MKNISFFFEFLARVLMLAVPLMLSACGGGDGNTDISNSGGEEVISSLDEVESAFSGSVGDGPIVGATLKVYDKDHNLIRTVISDADAKYSARIKAKGSAFPLTIEVEDGTDLVTGQAPDFKLVSVVLRPSVKHVNINPFSTMIVEAARTASGGLSEESVSAARSAVIYELNFGLDPLIVADPIGLQITDSSAAVLIKSSETMGEMIRRVRDQMMVSGVAVDGNDVVAAIADDISDGTLNGMGGNRANPRISAVSRVVSAQVLIEALSNNLRVQDDIATSRLDAAIVSTSSSAGLDELTGQVRINREMLEQARESLDAARALVPSIELSTISRTLDTIQANSLPSEIEPVLPADSSVDLDSVITSAVLATDEQLDVVNNTNKIEGPVGVVDPVNSAPQLSGNPLTSVLEGSDYLFQPVASDADADTLTFTVSNKPSWATFDSASGRLAGTPGAADAGVYSDIVISVSDGSATDSLGPFSITVASVNHAPAISGNAQTSANEGVLYSFKPTASDPDGDSLVFSISGRPSWATFDTGRGRLYGTPGANDAGTYSDIVISVSDGVASSSLPAFSIVVNANKPSNTAPTITGAPAASVAEDSAYLFQPVASDVDGDNLTFSISNRPAWASFDSATGRLSGTPRNGDVGTSSNIRINVSDGAASASTGLFSITVSNTNDAPTISGTPATSVSEDSTYVFQPNSADVDGDNLTFSISNRPSWASFNASTGRLSGTPNNADVGQYSNITIRVSDGSASAALGAFSIKVNNTNDAPIISGVPASSVDANTAYSFQPSASDPDGDNLVFSISNRPAWTSFDTSTGRLSGTPGSAGAFSDIRIAVSDGQSTVALPTFSITVNDTAPQTGSVSLSWTAPVARADGTALSLSEIAGYRVYYGTSAGNYSDSVDVNSVSSTSVTITSLPVGTYYMVATTRDSDGRESAYSQEVTKVAQ
jgi:hypothetical protein